MIIRVYPRRTKWTPTDRLAFVGEPPLFIRETASADVPMMVSTTFTWDRKEAHRLVVSWSRYFDEVQCGGPAIGSSICFKCLGTA